MSDSLEECPDPRINWVAVDELILTAQRSANGHLAGSAIRWAVSGFIENCTPLDIQQEWLTELGNQFTDTK